MSPRLKTKESASAPNEERELKYTGPYWRVEANAKHSPTFTGKTDCGTFTESEYKKGAVGRRVAQLEAEGYKGINVREVGAE